ncbi:hypothetical protein K7J14_01705 [Treponema zuelzerae]|uniref:Uncharacterized protein n=1 Tax=Teretinema zuelzerae TaxID=156 RepID=A0AAE3JHU2_9SPIR|nr:hypothetical protein [Teretinema zuelzerae]MCD1653413.1 hypothetical protein [Teretinema zuelzerae]
MNENKPTARRVMIISIVALALFYIAGDWAVYLFGKSKIALAPAFLCAVATAKYAASCLSFAVVCSTREDRLDNRDWFWLFFAFVFLILADFCMVFLYPVLAALDMNPPAELQTAGIICFMAVQTCLIVRHARNVRNHYRMIRNSPERSVAKSLSVEAAVLLIAAIPVVAAAYAANRNSLPVMIVYGIYVVLSLAAAWTVFFHRFFPKKNSWMIALGVSCFFLCDVNVGLSFLSPFATTLVWMFYTPTLLLLSSSGIDFDKRRIISMRRRYFKAS